MKKIMELTNKDNGLIFNVYLISRGGRYGLNDCLTHKKDDPLLEFSEKNQRYDGGERFFGARYYLKTLLGEDEWSSTDLNDPTGLNLYGGVANWYLTRDNMIDLYTHFLINRSLFNTSF